MSNLERRIERLEAMGIVGIDDDIERVIMHVGDGTVTEMTPAAWRAWKAANPEIETITVREIEEVDE